MPVDYSVVVVPMVLLVRAMNSTKLLVERSDIESHLVVHLLVVVARASNRALGIEN